MTGALMTSTAAVALALAVGLPALAAGFAPGVGDDGSITVPPVDYRKDWALLGTFVTNGTDDATDFHVVYTQPETVAHYRQHGTYPDGAVLVKELLKTESGDLTTGRISWAAEPVGWFVMVKDTEGRFPDHPLWGDGWGWALFEADDPDTTVTADYREDCLSCHEPVRATDLSYVQGYPTLKGPAR